MMSLLILCLIMPMCTFISCSQERLLPMQLTQKDISRYTRRETCLWAAGALLGVTELAAGIADSNAPWPSLCDAQYLSPIVNTVLVSSTLTSCWNMYRGWRSEYDDKSKINLMKNLHNYFIRAYGSLSVTTASLAFLTCSPEARATLLVIGGILGAPVDTVGAYLNLGWLFRYQSRLTSTTQEDV